MFFMYKIKVFLLMSTRLRQNGPTWLLLFDICPSKKPFSIVNKGTKSIDSSH